MGQSFGYQRGNQNQDDELVFVVPNYMNLSINQVTLLMDSGQQPGVPFSLSDGGATRPQGFRVGLRHAECFASVQKYSIRIVDTGTRKCSLCFVYDSNCSSTLTVLFGCKERMSSSKLMFHRADIQWGPILLLPGKNLEWCSDRHGLILPEAQLNKCTTVLADRYDAIISLTPVNNTSSTISSTRPVLAGDSVGKAAGNLVVHDENQNNWVVLPVSPSNSAQDMNNNNNYVNNNGSNINKSVGFSWASSVTRSLPFVSASSSASSAAAADISPKLPRNTSQSSSSSSSPPPHQVLSEITFVRLSTSVPSLAVPRAEAAASVSASASAVAGVTYAVKSVSQKVEMAGGVYLLQDLYGIESGNGGRRPLDHPPDGDQSTSNNSNINNSNSIASNTNANNNESKMDDPPSTPSAESVEADNFIKDDSTECVICLTDQRCVSCYPCRHVCLCVSCSNTMPSQGNKCPICRRPVSMLLKLLKLAVANEAATD